MVSASETIDEASFKLRALASPEWHDTRETALAKAARMIGLTRSQAKRIAYREVKRVDAHVLENIRNAYARLEARAEAIVDDELNKQRAISTAQKAWDEDFSETDGSVSSPTR